jgi:uncharacterized membrane protein HdeD (DUF308 family)
MLRFFTRTWWTVALRGLLAVIFGVLALIWPQATVQALVLIFGVYVLFDGLFTTISAVVERRRYQRWGWVLVGGLLGIAIGVLALLWPDITAVALLYLIAANAILTGIFELVNAVELRRHIEGEWLLGLGGLLSVVFGVLLVVWPASGLMALTWLIGAYAVVFGVLLIVLGFKLRGLRRVVEASHVA